MPSANLMDSEDMELCSIFTRKDFHGGFESCNNVKSKCCHRLPPLVSEIRVHRLVSRLWTVSHIGLSMSHLLLQRSYLRRGNAKWRNCALLLIANNEPVRALEPVVAVRCRCNRLGGSITLVGVFDRVDRADRACGITPAPDHRLVTGE
jgi:hypothetical protein